ncbi:MAG: acyl-CoA dehydrogenase, partial [Ignavibacteria bacterium]
MTDIGVMNGFDLHLNESQRAVQELARAFAEEEIRPHVMHYDESQEFPFDIINKAAELGFMGMTWPEELGGAGLSELEAIIIIEEVAKVDPSVALTIASHNSLCTGHIMKFGNDEQKRR